MAGAALDYRDIRLRDETQQLGRLGTDILGPGMAGEVHRDTAGQRR